MARTFDEEFDNLVDTVWGNKLDKNGAQYRLMKKMFYAGAMVLLNNPDHALEVFNAILNKFEKLEVEIEVVSRTDDGKWVN